MNRKYFAVAAVVVGVLLVLGILLIIGIVQGDDTDMEEQPTDQTPESAPLVPGGTPPLAAA
ncbi:hypothetical protein [Nocardioides pacificus]